MLTSSGKTLFRDKSLVLLPSYSKCKEIVNADDHLDLAIFGGFCVYF